MENLSKCEMFELFNALIVDINESSKDFSEHLDLVIADSIRQEQNNSVE